MHDRITIAVPTIVTGEVTTTPIIKRRKINEIGTAMTISKSPTCTHNANDG